MHNLEPMNNVRRIIQRLQRESDYWLTRVTRLFPGGRGRRPQTPDLDDFKGSPVLLVAVGCVVLLCLCLTVVAGITAVLVVMGWFSPV
jgi:hypothetical protein